MQDKDKKQDMVKAFGLLDKVCIDHYFPSIDLKFLSIDLVVGRQGRDRV